MAKQATAVKPSTEPAPTDPETYTVSDIFREARVLCDSARARVIMLRERANAMHDEASALERFSAHATDGMSNTPTVGAVGSKY